MGETDKQENAAELQDLRDLYDWMVREDLESVDIRHGDSRIRLTRAVIAAAVEPTLHPHRRSVDRMAEQASASSSSSSLQPIVTPLAGVFYRASSPSSAPFVKENDVVSAGQPLCIVEAMKVMNEIKAESRCRIARILAENSRPVAAGQPLFLVEPA